MNYFVAFSSRIQNLILSCHLARASLFLVVLSSWIYSQPIRAEALPKTQTIVSGTITSGTVAKGNFIENGSNTNISLPTDKLKDLQINNGVNGILSGGNAVGGIVNLNSGSYTGNPASGVSGSSLTLSNAVIENAQITYTNDASHSVVVIGTLSSAEISNAGISNIILKSEPPVPTNTTSLATFSQEALNISFIGDRLEFNVAVPGFANVDGGAANSANQGDCFLISGENQDSLTGHFLYNKSHWYWPRCYSLGWGSEGNVTYKLVFD